MLSVVQNCTGKNWEENTAVLVQAPLFAGLYWCSLWAEASAGGSSLDPFIISSNLSSTCAQRSSYFLLFRKSEWVDTPTLHSKWTFQEYRMPLWKGVAKGIPLGQKLGQTPEFVRWLPTFPTEPLSFLNFLNNLIFSILRVIFFLQMNKNLGSW